MSELEENIKNANTKIEKSIREEERKVKRAARKKRVQEVADYMLGLPKKAIEPIAERVEKQQLARQRAKEFQTQNQEAYAAFLQLAEDSKDKVGTIETQENGYILYTEYGPIICTKETIEISYYDKDFATKYEGFLPDVHEGVLKYTIVNYEKRLRGSRDGGDSWENARIVQKNGKSFIREDFFWEGGKVFKKYQDYINSLKEKIENNMDHEIVE